MKRWPYIAILLIALAGVAWWAWQNRVRLGLSALLGTSGTANAGGSMDAVQPASIHWKTLNEKVAGFQVQMPAGSKDVEAPAVNESGGTEPVEMLRSSLDSGSGGDTVYAVTWADNPPVARVNNHQAGATLDAARDGMLASTQSTLVSETEITVAGFPGREILAHNSAGGILDVRLIYVPGNGSGSSDRLYTLMALFPTAGARSEKDVTRFFSSFKPASPRS